ncbi:MAG: rhodanese-like domain-containing protein [Planctomycetota bacterium]|nr:rhodanese-like domain-containing protein [Planctomycetota bacterium]
MSEITITPEMSMEEVLQRAPAAQRALFQRYHIGGCSHCAFQPEDTLGQVAKDHNILDINEMIATIIQAEDLDGKIQVEPKAVREWLDRGVDFTFLDCRAPEEWEKAFVQEAERLDYTDSGKYMGLPKDRTIVFLCKDGDRSLSVASYFIGHEFTHVLAVRGGLDAWRKEIDSSLPVYE